MTSTYYAQHIVCIAIIGYHRTYLLCPLHRAYILLPELNIAYLMLLGWPWSKGSDQSNRFMKRFGTPNLLARKNLGDLACWIFCKSIRCVKSFTCIDPFEHSPLVRSFCLLLELTVSYLKLVNWLWVKVLYASNQNDMLSSIAMCPLQHHHV